MLRIFQDYDSHIHLKEVYILGKEEKLLIELLDKVSSLEDKLTNMEFLLVQSMGAGGASVPISSSSVTPAAVPSSVEVDLTPLQSKMNNVEKSIQDINTKFEPINELVSTLNSEKSRKADELITQATTLLEQGLQLTELETTLLELKDRLDEITIQLEVANASTPNTSESS